MLLKSVSKQWLRASAFLLLPACFNAHAESLDKVVAIVNKDVVLESELAQYIHKIQVDAATQHQTLPPYHQLRKQVLDKLIDDSLVMQIADRQGLRISDSQLDQAIASIAEDKHVSVEQLKTQAQQEGLDSAGFRAAIKKEMTISEVRRNQLRLRINITEQEAKQLAKLLKDQGHQTQRFHIEHILLNLAPDATKSEQNNVTEKANALLKKLKSGADFHEMAVAESTDDKALNGGDWGWMTVDEMPSLMAEAVAHAKAGEFIGPLRSGAGLHIIHVKEIQGAQAAVEMTEVKARHILLKTSVILSDDKAKDTLNDYLKQIRSGKANFATLAEQHSDDTGSATQGGELGWSNPEAYVPEFRDMVKKLPVGQISQPFKTVHGWHIVQVEDRRNQTNTDEAMENRAYQMIYSRRFAEEAQTWMDELRDEAYIKLLDAGNQS